MTATSGAEGSWCERVSWTGLRGNRGRVREALAGAMNASGYWQQFERIEVELDKDEEDAPKERSGTELLRDCSLLGPCEASVRRARHLTLGPIVV